MGWFDDALDWTGMTGGSWSSLFGGGGGGGTPNLGVQIDPQQWLQNAPQSFQALQGMPQGFNPQSGEELALMTALTSGAPGRIDQFQSNTNKYIHGLGRAGHRAIDQQAANQYASGANQLGRQQRQMQGQQADAFAAMGLAPSMFHGSVMPQQQMELGSQLGQLRGQTYGATPGQHQQLREQQFDRRTGLNQASMNARNQLEQYYDSLMLQKYLSEIGAQAQMYGANKAADAQMSGDMMALAAAAMMAFSDARLKEDVHTLVEGSPRIASWRWNRTAEGLGLRGRGVGVIAQELEQIAPELVVTHSSGFKMVRYR